MITHSISAGLSAASVARSARHSSLNSQAGYNVEDRKQIGNRINQGRARIVAAKQKKGKPKSTTEDDIEVVGVAPSACTAMAGKKRAEPPASPKEIMQNRDVPTPLTYELQQLQKRQKLAEQKLKTEAAEAQLTAGRTNNYPPIGHPPPYQPPTIDYSRPPHNTPGPAPPPHYQAYHRPPVRPHMQGGYEYPAPWQNREWNHPMGPSPAYNQYQPNPTREGPPEGVHPVQYTPPPPSYGRYNRGAWNEGYGHGGGGRGYY